MDQLKGFISAIGYCFDVSFFDNEWHEIRCLKTNTKINYKARKDSKNKTEVVFKVWKENKTYYFKEDGVLPISEEEAQRLKKEKKERWKLQAVVAREKFLKGNLEKHPYLTNKKIDILVQCITTTSGQCIMVPMKDFDGKIWNIQFIQHLGHKSNIAKSKVTGLFYVWGDIKKAEHIFICEGYATALTLGLATNQAAVCCFGINNVENVVKQFLKHNYKNLILALDNDHENKLNIGQITTQKILTKYPFLKKIIPLGLITKETDFNDLLIRKGAEEVRKQISEQISNPVTLPLLVKFDHLKEKKNTKNENQKEVDKRDTVSEGQIADQILSKMPELLQAKGNYFKWEGRFWERMDATLFEDKLLKLAIEIYQNKAPIRKIKALVEHTISKISTAPETNSFFQAHPTKFNFTDCTAEILEVNGKLELRTYVHNKLDYISYMAPFPLKEKSDLPTSTAFEQYMNTRKEDVGEDGIRIIKQMLGAALIPYIPRIFFIEGESNSGKSTLAKLIIKLLGEHNVSSVNPVINGYDRFLWEPSIGKIANISLELPKNKEIDVNTLKMVRDKTPINIDRKSQKHVFATLPFFHIYCCNQMPPSFEGNSGALNNRITMLYFKQGYLNGLGNVLELSEHIWSTDAGSVLLAAREGLSDLVSSNFHYFVSEESKKTVKKWQKNTDSILLYVDDVKSGEWNGPDLIGTTFESGKIVYEDYKNWAKDSGKKPIGKHNFYNELENKLKLPTQKTGRGGVKFDLSSVFPTRKISQKSSEQYKELPF